MMLSSIVLYLTLMVVCECAKLPENHDVIKELTDAMQRLEAKFSEAEERAATTEAKRDAEMKLMKQETSDLAKAMHRLEAKFAEEEVKKDEKLKEMKQENSRMIAELTDAMFTQDADIYAKLSEFTEKQGFDGQNVTLNLSIQNTSRTDVNQDILNALNSVSSRLASTEKKMSKTEEKLQQQSHIPTNPSEWPLVDTAATRRSSTSDDETIISSMSFLKGNKFIQRQLDHGIQELSALTEKASQRENSAVGFSASSSDGYYYYEQFETIKFYQTISNIGGHYNRTESVFTCPVDGIYYFTFSLNTGSLIDSRYTWAEIVAGIGSLSHAYCSNSGPDFLQAQCGNSAVTHCSQGDLVYITTRAPYTQVYSFVSRSTFSGFLIQEDIPPY